MLLIRKQSLNIKNVAIITFIITFDLKPFLVKLVISLVLTL